MTEGLVWERVCTLDFAQAVGRYIRDVAELSQRVEVKNAEANRGKLRPADPGGNLSRLADFVKELDSEDQVLAALQQTNAESRPDEYKPARDSAQFRLLRRLAGASATEPARVLEGLVVAAAVDADEQRHRARSAQGRAEEQATQLGRELEAAREELTEARSERYDLQTRVDGLEERVRELTDQLDWERAGDDGEPESNGSRKRRQPVDGEDHIYWGENAAGVVVYEVDWRDDGRRRWKTVGPDLDEARAKRDELWSVVT